MEEKPSSQIGPVRRQPSTAPLCSSPLMLDPRVLRQQGACRRDRSGAASGPRSLLAAARADEPARTRAAVADRYSAERGSRVTSRLFPLGEATTPEGAA
jgi:hypothetical protein